MFSLIFGVTHNPFTSIIYVHYHSNVSYIHLSLQIPFSLFLLLLPSPSLIICNVPHAYVDNIQINIDDSLNETLLIISRVRLPRESDKRIILISMLYIWVLQSINENSTNCLWLKFILIVLTDRILVI